MTALWKKVGEGRATPETMALMERAQRDMEYLGAHWRELKATYPDEWIAIRDEQLVGHAPDHEVLLQDLRRRGIQPVDALIEFMSETPLILSAGSA